MGCQMGHAVHPEAPSESMRLPTPALICVRWGVHLQDHVPDMGGGGLHSDGL